MTKVTFALVALPPVLIFGLACTFAQSNEVRILAYQSEITVHPNATVQAVETITVVSPSEQGDVYRDFSSVTRDRFGNSYAVHLHVDAVERDGEPQEFSLAKLPEGLRVYLDKGRSLGPPGQHTYKLSYTLDRALGIYAEHDELFWEVTGTAWPMPIQEVSATVHLPKGITQRAIILDAYTGGVNSVRTDYTASVDKQSNAYFRTTRPLGPRECLSIVVRWPKGFTRPPTDDEKNQYYFEDNLDLLTALAAAGIVLLFYVGVWFLAGRRQSSNLPAARGVPPRGFSPGRLRYTWRNSFDHRTLAVSLVDLAVRKQIALLEDATGAFILGRMTPGAGAVEARPTPAGAASNSSQGLSADERLVLAKFFARSRTIRLEPINRGVVGNALEALGAHLRFQTEKAWLVRTAPYTAVGLGLSLLAVLRCGLTVPGANRVPAWALAPLVLAIGFAALVIAWETAMAWKALLLDALHRGAGVKRALSISGVALLVWAAEVAGLEALAWATSELTAILVITLVTLTFAVHCALKLSKRLASGLHDDIEGFRAFLLEADKDQHKTPATPPKTSAFFERYLGYALALNVEKAWSEKFAQVIAGTPAGGKAYAPEWYTGRRWSQSAALGFALALGTSLSAALASASAPPSGHVRKRQVA